MPLRQKKNSDLEDVEEGVDAGNITLTGNTVKAGVLEIANAAPVSNGGSVSNRTVWRGAIIIFTVFAGCFGGAFVATSYQQSLASSRGDSDNIVVESVEKPSHINYNKGSQHNNGNDKKQPNDIAIITKKPKSHGEVHQKIKDVLDDYGEKNGLSGEKLDYLHKKNDKLHGFSDSDLDSVDGSFATNVLHKVPEWVNTKSKVQQIVLIGERNTGSRWVTRLLASCFPDIYVSTTLTRWKHWFQYDDGLEHPKTLVVGSFLNPYDWVENMRLVPHDQPEHMDLEWKEFVTKVWTMPRPERDTLIEDKSGKICQYMYEYNDVIPCTLDPEVEKKRLQKNALKALLGGERTGNTFTSIHSKTVPKAGKGTRTPAYEMRYGGDGEPYESLVDMRKDKILNHFSVKEYPWVVDFFPVQFESLVKGGAWKFLREVEEIVGTTATCSDLPLPKSLEAPNIPKEMIEWITDRVDWETEAMVGYGKREV
uniref:Sulfotransferase domain-containing protein n=1 Tax=Leptocylindrus danicus TaxID=163516 RepID=A0A7S2KRW7_9STRA|mmetsp:Transcript_25394/g.37945  ORF Transcript_25394/g.37945 Transcript_25394/m.37945 type:complete len:480 (+) Transcript_25394:111-1550(+)